MWMDNAHENQRDHQISLAKLPLLLRLPSLMNCVVYVYWRGLFPLHHYCFLTSSLPSPILCTNGSWAIQDHCLKLVQSWLDHQLGDYCSWWQMIFGYGKICSFHRNKWMTFSVDRQDTHCLVFLLRGKWHHQVFPFMMKLRKLLALSVFPLSLSRRMERSNVNIFRVYQSSWHWLAVYYGCQGNWPVALNFQQHPLYRWFQSVVHVEWPSHK